MPPSIEDRRPSPLFDSKSASAPGPDAASPNKLALSARPPKSPMKNSLYVNNKNRGRSGNVNESDASRPGRARSRSLGKRLASFARTRSLTPRGKHRSAAGDGMKEERDPVMDMLQARNIQKVRFSLEVTPGGKGSASDARRSKTSTDENLSSFNIRAFMKKSLFGKSAVDVKSESPVVWESGDSAEIVQSSAGHEEAGSEFTLTFVENPDRRAEIVKLLNKGRLAQYSYFRYQYAVKCFVKALKKLNHANYPDDHPLMLKTLRSLNNAHHALSSFDNSANIVKMGIRFEESGDLVRALKMYTVAYRIRRDNLSRAHPSLPVLLNILASIQAKRGELKEAMSIYELALREVPTYGASTTGDEVEQEATGNLLIRASTFREMAAVQEKLGDERMALAMYHKSLDCSSRWRGMHESVPYEASQSPLKPHNDLEGPESVRGDEHLCSLLNVRVVQSFQWQDKGDGEIGEMEMLLSSSNEEMGRAGEDTAMEFYGSFCPPNHSPVDETRSSNSVRREEVDRASVEIALTLHQIGQMHRREGQYDRALDAFRASLRGMRYSFGSKHPNVAAVLGNIGNLQKDMGLLNDSYETYQEVLAMESRRLGISHPEVAVSLHNVATIEAARGNYAQALSIYGKVLNLQRKLFGKEHISIAVTLTCIGDVYQRVGELKKAMQGYEEALKIMTATLGRHHIEVARMLHKMGRISARQEEYRLADSFVTRALLLYRLNKVSETHEWIVDAHRFAGDIDAALAMGRERLCEC